MTTRRLQAMIGGIVLTTALTVPGIALADDYVDGEDKKPQVKGEQVVRPQVEGDTESRGLPITGGDVAGMTAIGVAAVATGTVLVRRARRTA